MKPGTRQFLFICMVCVAPGLLFVNCGKHNLWAPEDTTPKMPPATSEGKMTFGCTVNGKLFVHFYYSLNASYKNGAFFMWAGDGRSNQYLSIKLDSISGPGRYLPDNFKLNPPYSYLSYIDNDTSGFNVDYHYRDSGEINFTRLDTTNKILSATFSFNMQNDKGDIVRIRDGRFDIKFDP